MLFDLELDPYETVNVAASNIDVDALRESQIVGLQKNNTVEEAPEENLYAETQESIGEEVDYSSNSEDDMFSHDAGLGTEAEPDFSDNIIEEDRTFAHFNNRLIHFTTIIFN